MNKKLKLTATFLGFLLLCCAVRNGSNNVCIEEPTAVVFAPTTVSVCHNPDSKTHNKLCSAECYESGNYAAYCYDLPTDICNEGWDREPWISDICKEIINSLQ